MKHCATQMWDSAGTVQLHMHSEPLHYMHIVATAFNDVKGKNYSCA
jgi:hypothetical protein